MKNLAPYAKSLLGGLVSAISFAVPVVDDGLVPSEILGIALAGLLGLGVVFAVPNRAASTGQRGVASIAELAFAAFIVVCALVVLVRFLG